MKNHNVVVIGASAGGVEALARLCARLPADFPAAVLIVQHLSPSAPSQLARLLARAGPLPTRSARDGEPLQHGHIYVAVPDHHLLLRRGWIEVRRGPHQEGNRPSVNALFRSAALAYGSRVIGVVLTGALGDGAAGLVAIKLAGGTSIVQSPDDAAWPSMPRRALEFDQVDHTVTLAQLPELLTALVTRDGDHAAQPVHGGPPPADRRPGADMVPSAPPEPDAGIAATPPGLSLAPSSDSAQIRYGVQIAIRTHRQRLAMFNRLQDACVQKGQNFAARRWRHAAAEAEHLAQALERTAALLGVPEPDAAVARSRENTPP